MIYRPWRH